jgi:HD superfamily phosphohydrolase
VLPELHSLDERRHLVRIPHEMDVPLTPRVLQLIDTPEFRRLSRISQLGLVTLVYPGATHSRFEHSLGVYRNALLYLKQLSSDERFTSLVTDKEAEVFLVAALLHDLGHWPFCHPIEDIRLPGVPHHELFANSFLLEGELADVLRDEWQLNPREVVSLLSEKPRDARGRLLSSLLSGPIDIDKMDYLVRDSLHAGVPYGRHFDQQRLIGSLCLNEAGDGLAISEKGRTAAEMMVFARYVMFNEVYWHHAVRSATAMLQRAFSLLQHELELDALFRLPESAFIDALLAASAGTPAEPLLAGLFGPARRLYKRLAEFSFFQHRELYEQIARRPFPWLSAFAEKLAEGLSRRLGRRAAPHEVLVDAPPVKREIEFSVDVYFPKEKLYRPLGDVSPAIHTLATRQFDDFVKRVRIFLHPALIADARQIADIEAMVAEALDGMK